MASIQTSPDSLAKRLFVVTMIGVVLCIAVIFVLMGSGEKSAVDIEDHGVTTALLP